MNARTGLLAVQRTGSSASGSADPRYRLLKSCTAGALTTFGRVAKLE